MKKYITSTIILLASFFIANAQQDEPNGDDAVRHEKIYPLYVAYVTKELNLTTEEAQKFWPIHAQFESELKAVKKGLRPLEIDEARLNIKKKYQGSFSNVLGANRCDKFFGMRGAFQKRLLERIKRQQMNKNPRPGMRRMQ